MKTLFDRLIAFLTAIALIALPVNGTAATGDFNFDGETNYADLAKWESAFSIDTEFAAERADGDGDFDSDGRDFLIWQQAAAGGSMIAPEPTTLALTVPFMIFLIARRQRPLTIYRFDEAHLTVRPLGLDNQRVARTEEKTLQAICLN